MDTAMVGDPVIGVGRPLRRAPWGPPFSTAFTRDQCSGPGTAKSMRSGPDDRPPALTVPAIAPPEESDRSPAARAVTVARWPGSSSTSRRSGATGTSGGCGPARWSPGMGSQLTLVAVSFQAYASDPLDADGRADRPGPAGAAAGRGPLGRHPGRRRGPKEGVGPHPGRHGDGGRRIGGQRRRSPIRRSGRCLCAPRPARASRGSTGRRAGPPCRCWSASKT